MIVPPDASGAPVRRAAAHAGAAGRAVHRLLNPGESLVLPPRQKHWVALARAVVRPLLWIAALVALSRLVAARAPQPSASLSLVLVALVVGALWAIWAWLEWRASSLTVTDRRVIFAKGILIRTIKVIPLDRVQDVSTRQNLPGRLFGYGDLEIDSGGSFTNEVFTRFPSPEIVREQVFALSESLKRGA